MAGDFRVGKLPKRSDYRTLSLASYTKDLPDPPPSVNRRRDLPDPPPSVDHRHGVHTPWGMLGNDKLLDCTCAGAGHAEMTWSALESKKQLAVTTADIEAAYSAITGYTPADPTTDKGAALLSVLKYWRSTGIADEKIGAFAEVPPGDLRSVKLTIQLFGLAYVGLQLPSNAVPENGKLRTFTSTRRCYDPATWRNPFNGHCVIYIGYETEGLTCVSWGRTMAVSWAFHRDYCDELYAIISPARMSGQVATEGLNLDLLNRELDAVTA